MAKMTKKRATELAWGRVELGYQRPDLHIPRGTSTCPVLGCSEEVEFFFGPYDETRNPSAAQLSALVEHLVHDHPHVTIDALGRVEVVR